MHAKATYQPSPDEREGTTEEIVELPPGPDCIEYRGGDLRYMSLVIAFGWIMLIGALIYGRVAA